MKIRSLIKVIESVDGGIHLTFFRPSLSLRYAARDKEHAIEVARRFCLETIDREGRPWIEFWKGGGRVVTLTAQKVLSNYPLICGAVS